MRILPRARVIAGKAEFEGDFRNGFIDFGRDKHTDACKANKRKIDMNNGWTAQIGILGLMVHDA
eukprot:CAMPEP_0172577956 /NCGR_PEP_ID=MMETSP1067-20121228/138493_1 /TAXON_ID=265564 ORGANISM="Thalassiosira punctigera, Strain Tpunct2005C2" /NCGR_SAMPLE_ID=MMETSP1067 /ASSEMBLY_ACC=CAM_ASM_000444 /LENGTH=63 /DNA_ID=CAMNT_0013370647 /DNA_START=153 /DNA_END=344 /DNA_ORIENTATION=-